MNLAILIKNKVCSQNSVKCQAKVKDFSLKMLTYDDCNKILILFFLLKYDPESSNYLCFKENVMLVM